MVRAGLAYVPQMKLVPRAAVAAFVLCAAAFAMPAQPQVPEPHVEFAGRYAREVDRRLDVPPEIGEEYAARLAAALAQVVHREPQFAVLVDRSPAVQAVFVYWGSPGDRWRLVGASPTSTGLPGRFDYFETPVGVFEHTLANPDFRAEGTRNKNGIRGYGARGMRVYDFGWASSPRTWGTRGPGVMRLQMHATDRELLEPWLGTRRSKGCIRIPASLNLFIDRYGLLDADYERAVREGRHLWVLREDRSPTPWPGRYLVIVDSGRATRPAWSPLPGKRRPGPRAQEASRGVC